MLIQRSIWLCGLDFRLATCRIGAYPNHYVSSQSQWICLDLHLDRPAPALRQERPFLFTQKGELRVLDQAT